jgi:hypothetical protein
LNERAEVVSTNLKIEGNSEDIEQFKELFKLIPIEIRKMDWTKPFVIPSRLFLGSIDYEDIVIRSSERLWQTSEIPAANGHGNARAVAKLASIIACGGKVNNIRFLSRETVEQMLEEQIYDTDLSIQIPISWGLGVALKTKMISFPNERTCFWQGGGGSGIIMDLENKMGIGYVMNQFGNQPMSETMSNKYLGDTRGNRVITALYESLGLI